MDDLLALGLSQEEAGAYLDLLRGRRAPGAEDPVWDAVITLGLVRRGPDGITAAHPRAALEGWAATATLIVQSELDAATAYEGAAKAAKTRPNTSMISVDNEGSHGVFPYLTTCVDDQVEAFMLTGARPTQAVCEAKPLPEETQSFATGASLGGNGKLKVKTMPKEVREANAFVRSLLDEQAQTP